jgi:two-component system NtrC family sensor kinase
MEDAVKINAAALDANRIQLARDFHPVLPVVTDRHKVLQILVNLISNAAHALSEKPSDRKLVMTVCRAEPNRVRISVSDNGVGIEPGNLDRIFAQGFTTRKGGHGFGLHSSANSAKELGGKLTAHSEGLGRGATFVLDLPAAGKAA